uniref:KIB1-4 beta-propeller domain-containing protein n=1 Tax=Triticum urartu TaxID=4572 RepID=A0A8R7NWA8_TRIUA
MEEGSSRRHLKYLVAAPGGRLMVVLKYGRVTKKRYGREGWTCSFKVHVLGDDGQWNETRDIGDVVLFVGVNNSMCVPTRGRPEIEAGCVYFTDDRLSGVRKEFSSRVDDDDVDVRAVGVYSLKDDTVKKMEALGQEYNRCRFSSPPVWITPSI